MKTGKTIALRSSLLLLLLSRLSCVRLSNPMDCIPPGSSIHGIFQARVLEWGAIAFSTIALRSPLVPLNLADITLMAESEEELKSLLMKVKEESEKVNLKLNIHKTKIMASGPATSWQIDGETVETVADFIFLDYISPKSLQMVTAVMKLKDAYSLEGKL